MGEIYEKNLNAVIMWQGILFVGTLQKGTQVRTRWCCRTAVNICSCFPDHDAAINRYSRLSKKRENDKV